MFSAEKRQTERIVEGVVKGLEGRFVLKVRAGDAGSGGAGSGGAGGGGEEAHNALVGEVEDEVGSGE